MDATSALSHSEPTTVHVEGVVFELITPAPDTPHYPTTKTPKPTDLEYNIWQDQPTPLPSSPGALAPPRAEADKNHPRPLSRNSLSGKKSGDGGVVKQNEEGTNSMSACELHFHFPVVIF